MIERLVLWLVAFCLVASIGIWLLQLVSDGWGIVVLVTVGAGCFGWYLRRHGG